MRWQQAADKEIDEQFFPNPDVDFTYAVDGDEYQYDFYVVSTIKFNNTSAGFGQLHMGLRRRHNLHRGKPNPQV